jgi:hypothetical protein
MILGFLLAAVSLLGDTICGALPLFYEVRCIVVWGLIIAEPVAWSSAYDKGLGPALGQLGTAAKGLRNSTGAKLCALAILAGAAKFLQRMFSFAASIGLLPQSGEQLRKSMLEVDSALLAEKALLQSR